MIPELGLFALALGFTFSLLLGTLPLWGAQTGNVKLMTLARPLATGQFLFVAFSYLALTLAFILDDFSVLYVANTSNTKTPLIYKISGVWGGHEGSILLWLFVLALWTWAVSIFNRGIPEQLLARVLGVLGIISIGFMLFILLTSNPFERLFPYPVNGADLNPLLQDIGMAAHPPLLYMGYVGFSVAFAFAIAILIEGRFDSASIRWMRPWTNVAWLFLTLGIALGSFWAYYELGWGGWWFWDPVENASFMPWLVGTALIHSLAATEKRNTFKAWSILLAILAFSLSLLGTFLVRSGVLTSVHAFATDPTRGLFILLLLVVVIGGSLVLYSARASKLVSPSSYTLVSRESGLLVNNVLLVVATATVLLGTLYPLVIDSLGLGKLSVGPPYFNAVFIPLMVPLMVAVGVGSLLKWKKDTLQTHRTLLLSIAVICIVGAALLLIATVGFNLAAFVGIALALWVTLSTVYGLVWRIRHKPNKLKALIQTPVAFWGMSIAHLGIAVMAVGIVLTSVFSNEKEILMRPGDVYSMGGYDFSFEGLSEHKAQNYSAIAATITVTREGEAFTVLRPEKRSYDARTEVMTEAAIDGGLSRDLFVALGERVSDDGGWSFRMQYKPFVRWIWLGAIFMALGGMLASMDKRYRQALSTRRERKPQAEQGGVATTVVAARTSAS